jgi:acetyl esterase/lipase
MVAYSVFLAAGFSDCVLMAESAGGCLALLLLQRLAREGLRAPDAAILMSPVTDLTCSGPSFKENAGSDDMIDPLILDVLYKAVRRRHVVLCVCPLSFRQQFCVRDYCTQS